MPSDPRVIEALRLLQPAIARYRQAVAATLEDVRGDVAASRLDAQGRLNGMKAQLGAFASGRIDVERLASLVGDRARVDATAAARLQAAYDTLTEIADRGDDLFIVEVPAHLGAAVAAQLAEIGRAFAAARVIAMARGSAAALPMDEAHALSRFPFAEWIQAERRLAPPLVVITHGRDLNAGMLTPYIDGGLKIVLLVDGPCAPAPLVRSITPNVFVMQAHDVKELASLAEWPGPAIGALVPPTGARFVHDPSAGPELWQRLTIGRGRDGRLARLGGLSAAQQNEELLQLEALATPPVAVAAPVAEVTAPAGAAGPDPAARLAAWLLQQANL